MENELNRLDTLLQDSRRRAFLHVNNTFDRDMQYYLQYMDMRREQYAILCRISDNIRRLTQLPRQAYVVANFMRLLSYSVHEHNNATGLIRELEVIRSHFRSGDLPASREEFEARAILYEIVFELRQLLRKKQAFAAALTPSQIRTFWEMDSQPNK